MPSSATLQTPYSPQILQLAACLLACFYSAPLVEFYSALDTLTAIGEQYLTVVNPLPGGGVSASVTITPYQTLGILPSALVSVPATGLLYAAIPASAPTNPNTVISINPATGAEGTPIPMGNNPQFLAASSNGAYLFVANQTDLTVQRINLTTNAVEKTFPYTPGPATDLQTVPGVPQEVLLAQGSLLSLYNGAGLVNYVPNDGICCYADPDFGSIALAGNPLTIYGLPFSFGGGFFQTVTLTSSGLQYTRPTGYRGGPNNTTGAQVISDGTLLYTSAGQVWNPTTQVEVGTFPVTTINDTSFPNMRNLTLDTALGQLYVVGYDTTGPVEIKAYGMQSHAVTGALTFLFNAPPEETNLVRWGKDGLAFIAPGANTFNPSVYLIRSSIVAGQQANPIPVLNSISPGTVNQGNPAFTITTNGTGFLSSSAIEWNGSALATTYVSSQQLTAIVPAVDMVQAGTAQVSVFSPAPGGGNSAVTDLPIVAPVSTAASLSIVPGGGALTTGSSYALTVAVTALSGNGVPPGNVVFTIGSAMQTVALNASGIATFTGTAPATAGSLSISAAYQGAPGFLASTSNPLNETVAAIATTTALATSSQQLLLGAQVTLTAAVTPASGTAMPTGSLSFYSGSSLLGTESLSNGAAILNTSALPAGSNLLTASYVGASSFAPSNSSGVTVAVNNPLSAIANLSPSFVSAGGAAFTLTVSGSGFIPASTLYWGSTALVTQYTSATQLTAQVTTTEIASAEITSITVQTPIPGGGTSNLVQFEVDTAASGSASAPSFTTLTATVAPGSTASYPVTLTSGATDVSVSCLNLPVGATCTYSAAVGAVTITTSATTPAGTYQITVVFTETLPGAATAMVYLPILLLPLLFARIRLGAREVGFMAFLALALALTVAIGCGGGSSGSGQTQASTHVATSSGVVTLTVQ
jgi:hypothetical protein